MQDKPPTSDCSIKSVTSCNMDQTPNPNPVVGQPASSATQSSSPLNISYRSVSEYQDFLHNLEYQTLQNSTRAKENIFAHMLQKEAQLRLKPVGVLPADVESRKIAGGAYYDRARALERSYNSLSIAGKIRNPLAYPGVGITTGIDTPLVKAAKNSLRGVNEFKDALDKYTNDTSDHNLGNMKRKHTARDAFISRTASLLAADDIRLHNGTRAGSSSNSTSNPM